MMLLMAMALSVSAQDTGTITVTVPTKEKKVCRTVRVTGSRLAGRQVCQTESERRAEMDSTRRDMFRRQDAMTQYAGVTPPPEQ